MKTSLTAGLKGEEKDEIVSSFLASARLRERLIYVLTNKLESDRREVRSKNTYESPSWGYVQADFIGYERAISELISLLSSKTD